MNLSETYVRTNGFSLYDFECIDLARKVSETLPGSRLLYITARGGGAIQHAFWWKPWGYHCVVELDGMVHDAWLPGVPVALVDYAARAFPEQDVKLELSPDGEFWEEWT